MFKARVGVINDWHKIIINNSIRDVNLTSQMPIIRMVVIVIVMFWSFMVWDL